MDKSVEVVGGKEYYGKSLTAIQALGEAMVAFDNAYFETNVLLTVVAVLGPVPASFTNGTLFVECTVPEAVRLETVLLETTGMGIILSRVGDESAYDFV